jgi:acetyltransferase-like isoleucine patch superfamily enzyme
MRPRVTIGNYSSVSYETECLFTGAGIQARALRGESAVSSLLTDDGLAASEIRFGNDVWVTRGTRILGGVNIGDGAVVAAYSVVTDDVRPYAIVAGNPAREIGRRFDDETVAALLRIQWWNWPDDEVKSRWKDLCSTDVRGFVKRYGAL